MPILEAIFIGTAAISSLMGIKHSKKITKKTQKKETILLKKKSVLRKRHQKNGTL